MGLGCWRSVAQHTRRVQKPTYKHPSCIFSLPQGGGPELVITKLSDFVKALGNGTLGGDGFFNIGV